MSPTCHAQTQWFGVPPLLPLRLGTALAGQVPGTRPAAAAGSLRDGETLLGNGGRRRGYAGLRRRSRRGLREGSLQRRETLLGSARRAELGLAQWRQWSL